MYICEEHGELDNNWCVKCNKIKSCDCSKVTSTRFKDLIYDCDDGERTITVYIDHCETCGDVISIR